MKLTALITSASQEVTIPVKGHFKSIKLLQAIHYKSSNTPKLLNIKIDECDNTNYYMYNNELFNYTFTYFQNGASSVEYREYTNQIVSFRDERIDKLTISITESDGTAPASGDLSSTNYMLLEFELQ